MRLNLIYIFFSLIVLSSCDTYKSDFPISESKKSSNCESIVGDWFLVNKANHEFRVINSLKISPINSKEYILKSSLYYNKGTTSLKAVDNFRIYKSKIRDFEYLNVQPFDNVDQSKFSFYSYVLYDSDSVRITYIRDSFDKVFESSKEFNRFIKNNQEEFNGHFSNEEITYYRLESLNWDFINLDSVKNMEGFFMIKDNQIQNDSIFKTLSNKNLEELNSVEIQIDSVTLNLNKYHYEFPQRELKNWKHRMKYGYVKMKNSSIIKLKIDKQLFYIYNFDEKTMYVKRDDEKNQNLNLSK